MAVEEYTLADLGYRKLGSLPASGGGWSAAQVAERVTSQGDYHATSDHWVRRHGRRKGAQFKHCIQRVAVLDRETPLEEDPLTFLDDHARSRWIEQESAWIRFRAAPEILIEAVQKAEKGEDRWRGMYRLSQALFYIGPERLRPMLRQHVAPCFFRLYPRGKIVVLRYDTGVDDAAALLRVLYAASQAPAHELLADDFRGVQTLEQWHMTSLTGLMPALLDLFSHLFYPFVGGTCAGLYGLCFLFVLDPPERYMPAAFPRNWLGFPSRSSSFGREAIDAVEVATDYNGPAHQRESHQRFCHAQGFTAEERLKLLDWFVGRVNRLLYELTDIANFTEDHEPAAVVDPVFGFEHQLTVDRLLRKTLQAMSLDEAPTANLMTFEIADLYDTLSVQFANRKNPTSPPYRPTEFFKALFHTQEGPAILVPSFADVPAPFGGYFADLAAQVYAKIEETVLASVWRQAKVTPNGVVVRDKELLTENPMPVPQFVAEVMRAYRNAHHGYFSADPVSQKRPLRFLFPVNGNLPVEMSALPVLWWLAYLADPNVVGWKHLKIDAYA